ncbi:hypothetical protein V8G54_026522 [Vigna mungo]|uniref:CCHC-type domain-containing protein n=1 Tax=Vigna mungo TaxID=3915 RepID=A0AAQ3RPJ8_VIGMU
MFQVAKKWQRSDVEDGVRIALKVFVKMSGDLRQPSKRERSYRRCKITRRKEGSPAVQVPNEHVFHEEGNYRSELSLWDYPDILMVVHSQVEMGEPCGESSRRKLLSVVLVHCYYGDEGIAGPSFVRLWRCVEEDHPSIRRRWFILREVFGGGVSSFVKYSEEDHIKLLQRVLSINRPPLFTGENYAFWKSIDCKIWDVIASGSSIPTNNLQEPKPRVQWTAEEKKRFQNDVKARNIISSALTVDEFYRISICKTAQEIWEVLRVTHEGTNDVKRARKNTLIQEYEMFRMKQGETISDVQKRFTNIVNHLIGLGKSFDNDELNIKILKSLDRSWQPKVTAISESQNLNTMTMTALFGKLREHELDLGRLDEEEEKAKTKKKSLALKSEVERSKNKIEDEDSEDEENLRLVIKRLNRFMKSKDKRRLKFEKKENQGSSSHYKCYGCRERGHLKADCPNQKKNEEIKEKKSFNKKKAYIAWDDDNETISDLSVSDEEANICLVADDDAGSQHVVYDNIVDHEVKPLESVKLDAGNDEDLQKTTKKRKIMTILKTKISTNYHHGDISKGIITKSFNSKEFLIIIKKGENLRKLLSVVLVHCYYGDGGIAGGVRKRIILREVFGGGVSSFVKYSEEGNVLSVDLAQDEGEAAVYKKVEKYWRLCETKKKEEKRLSFWKVPGAKEVVERGIGNYCMKL